MLNWIKVITRPFRRMLRVVIHKAVLRRDVRICRRNYRRKIAKCQEKLSHGQKIRVMFLVSELAKWKTQSLFDLMAKLDCFEPFIAISCMGDWRSHPEYKSLTDDSIAAFKEKGMKYVVVADFGTMKNLPLQAYNPDIIFYEQPYDWKREYMPAVTSRFAITAYVPYCVPTNEINVRWYEGDFLRTVCFYILLNQQLKDDLMAYVDPTKYAGQILPLGHTFYDDYLLDDNRPGDSKDLVIYAPHWTFDHPNNLNSLNISTFLWTGVEMLAYAERHPDVRWVFKPHPRLRLQLLRSKVWTEKEIDDYYNGWAKVGFCYYGSDYISLFKRSRVLITDCSSFVGEYPPCGGAVIHLRSSTEKCELLKAYKAMYDAFYQVHNLAEMYAALDTVVVRREDPNREERMRAVRELGLVGNNAAKNIVDFLMAELREN